MGRSARCHGVITAETGAFAQQPLFILAGVLARGGLCAGDLADRV